MVTCCSTGLRFFSWDYFQVGVDSLKLKWKGSDKLLQRPLGFKHAYLCLEACAENPGIVALYCTKP